MTEFLHECYVSADRTGITEGTRARVADIGAVAAESGLPARLIGSVLVPADDTWFLLWQADAESTVREIAQRAGVPCDRITEVVAWGSGPANIKGFQDAHTCR